MNVQIIISLFLALSIIGIVIWFYKENNSIAHLHGQHVSKLENAIFNNRRQINFRNSHLNKYDFLKYNLDESLVRQQEILIYEGYHEKID